MTSHQRPSSREDFEVALVCALPLELDAVCMVVDSFWDDEGDKYGKASEDRNTYYTGRIGKQNVVIVLLGKGKVSSSTSATSLRSSYPNIRLAILIGVCGGIPLTGRKQVRLGDVVISDTIVQYDFGRQNEHEFIRKKTSDNNSGSAPRHIVNFVDGLNTFFGRRRLRTRTAVFVRDLEMAATSNGEPGRYQKPDDNLMDTTTVTFRGQMLEDQMNANAPDFSSPAIHFGPVASGDTVFLSAEHRDRIAKAEGVVAFEMEGAGLWKELPCIIVKGVSDFADRKKTKDWQDYAAAMAAATSKAILERFIQTDKSPMRSPPPQPSTVKQHGSNFSGTIETAEHVDEGNKMHVSSAQMPRTYEQEGSTFAADIKSEKSVKQGNVMEFF